MGLGPSNTDKRDVFIIHASSLDFKCTVHFFSQSMFMAFVQFSEQTAIISLKWKSIEFSLWQKLISFKYYSCSDELHAAKCKVLRALHTVFVKHKHRCIAFYLTSVQRSVWSTLRLYFSVYMLSVSDNQFCTSNLLREFVFHKYVLSSYRIRMLNEVNERAVDWRRIYQMCLCVIHHWLFKVLIV
jgi:hypothetical protein